MKGLGRKLLYATVAGVVVFAALVLYGDLRQLGMRLDTFRWGAFGIALGLAATNYLVRFVRWEIYLRLLGVSIPRVESLLLYLSAFLMAITPGKIGEVWKSVLLSERHGVPLTRTAPIVVAERLTDLLALVLLASVGAITFRMGAAAIAAGIALCAGVLAVVLSKTLSSLAFRIGARIPGVRRVVPKLEEALGSLQALVTPRQLVLPTLLGVVAWFAECVAYYAVLRGFDGVHVGLEPATFIYAVSTIAGAVAMMPGGLGVTELGMTGLVQMLGDGTVSPSAASAATILVRLATLWFAVGVGGLAYAGLQARGRS